MTGADLPDDKETIRETFRGRRRALNEEERLAASRAVERRLAGRSQTLQAATVAGYFPFDNEVDVRGFLERRIEARRDVVLPRVEDDEHMEFVRVDDFDQDLEPGAFDIPEPSGSPVEPAEIEVYLVPGIAFDRDGGRIGRGAGYYDRALRRRLDVDGTGDDLLFVGVAYDEQLSETPLPTEDHDVRMHAIVTPSEWVRAADEAT